jgi:pimeloyl-ACP methyl ester carboxylesterase
MKQQWRAVLVHGAGGGAWEWSIWARALNADGIGVFAADLAANVSGIDKTSFRDYQAQVAQWLQAPKQANEQTVLIGASLGGLLAATQVQHADALILINPIPPSPLNTQLQATQWPDIVPWASESKFISTHRAMPDCDEQARIYAHRHWRDESGTVLREAYAGVECEKPSIPTLIIASENDAEIYHSVSLALAQEWRADFISIPNASHLGPAIGHSAAPTAAQAVAWLNGILPPG